MASKFQVNKHDNFDYPEHLDFLDTAANIFTFFDFTEPSHISITEIELQCSKVSILKEFLFFEEVANLQISFRPDSVVPEQQKEIACISNVAAMIGRHVFGVVFTAFGSIKSIKENQVIVTISRISVEQKLVRKITDKISREDLEPTIDRVFEKYKNDYFLVDLIEKPDGILV